MARHCWHTAELLWEHSLQHQLALNTEAIKKNLQLFLHRILLFQMQHYTFTATKVICVQHGSGRGLLSEMSDCGVLLYIVPESNWREGGRERERGKKYRKRHCEEAGEEENGMSVHVKPRKKRLNQTRSHHTFSSSILFYLKPKLMIINFCIDFVTEQTYFKNIFYKKNNFV